jgi:hypothetical protein
LTDNSNDTPVDINEDLAAFSDALFERTPAKTPVVEDEPEAEVEDEEVAETELETQEDEDPEEEETPDEDEDEEEKPQPKRGKKSFKERIDELTAEKYEARREADALRRELQAMKVPQKEEVQKEDVTKYIPTNGPQPDALDDSGNPVYPLGEFDPKFIADLTKFTINQEWDAVRQRQAAEERQKEVELAQTAIQQHWQENLADAEKDLPDIREKITEMVDVFHGIDASYGEYLAGTIMSCDHGPEIMYYLSQNIGEAQNIVASGPAAATLAIGRLEAQLDKSSTQEAPKSNKKVSDAPKPPEKRSRGTNGQQSVRPDTRDLAAFRREFYKQK